MRSRLSRAHRAPHLQHGEGLQPGESSLDVHNQWGEPDIRNYTDNHVQVWSYAQKANTNDITAEFFYTAPKEGDSGRFWI